MTVCCGHCRGAAAAEAASCKHAPVGETRKYKNFLQTKGGLLQTVCRANLRSHTPTKDGPSYAATDIKDSRGQVAADRRSQGCLGCCYGSGQLWSLLPGTWEGVVSRHHPGFLPVSVLLSGQLPVMFPGFVMISAVLGHFTLSSMTSLTE